MRRRHPRVNKLIVSVAAVVTLLAAAPAPQTSSGWTILARDDIAAAHRLLVDNHPGFAPEAGDARLVDAERRAYAAAMAATARVRSLGGYRAALDLYLNAMGDGHIEAFPNTRPLRDRWPGFLVVPRGNRWEVVESTGDRAPSNGSAWLGCDNRDPEAIAADRIGRFKPWVLPAHRRTNGALLMLDRDNPFVTPLITCRFTNGGTASELRLAWRPISSADVARRLAAATQLAPGRFDLRTAPDGALWIGYGEMSGRVDPVLAVLASDPERIRRAPYVVVDARGNPGGDSRFADRLAALLFDPNVVTAADRKIAGDNFQSWRASAGNAADLRQTARDNPDDAAWLNDLAKEMDVAIRARRSFVTPLPPRPWPAPAAMAPSADPTAARVLILSDPMCFSSCLVLVDRFRRYGAAHIGLPSDVSTNYLSGRIVELPSGLSRLIVMRVIGIGSNGYTVPIEPAASYDGDMTDEKAVMAWVSGLRQPVR